MQSMSKLTNKWELSPYMLKIKGIAEKEGYEISEETLEMFDKAVRKDATPTNSDIDIVLEVMGLIKDILEEKAPKVLKLVTKILKITKIGEIISHFIESKKPDPVLTALAELKVQLGKLSDKMTAEFEDLKKFIIENDFYRVFVNSLNALSMFMDDSMTDRRQAAVDTFRGAYEKHVPLEFVYNLLTMLKNEATNPLLWEMKSGDLKKKSTFSKWAGILRGVVMQSLILEAFSAGLLFKNDSYKMDKIVAKAALLEDYFKQWNAAHEKKFDMTVLKQHVQVVMDDSKIIGEEAKLEAATKIVDDVIMSGEWVVFSRDETETDAKMYSFSSDWTNFFTLQKDSIEILVCHTSATESLDELETHVTPYINGEIRCVVFVFFTNGDVDDYIKMQMDLMTDKGLKGAVVSSYGKPISLKCSQNDQKSKYIAHLPGRVHVHFWIGADQDHPVHFYAISA